MKRFIRSLLAHAGYALHRTSPDPLLCEMRAVHDRLRLMPGHTAEWQESFTRLALEALLRDLLRLHDPDFVVDVGANRGQFVRRLRQLGYAGPVLSLEPQADLAEALRNSGDPQWAVIRGGAGDEAGTLDLQVFSDDSFSSVHALRPEASANFGGMVQPTRVERIEVQTLDAWLANTPAAQARRIFLKTDTQGHDLAVLRGARSTLGRTCLVLAEASLIPLYDDATTLSALNSHLAGHSLLPAGFFPVSRRREDLAAIELDCIYTGRPVSAT